MGCNTSSSVKQQVEELHDSSLPTLLPTPLQSKHRSQTPETSVGDVAEVEIDQSGTACCWTPGAKVVEIDAHSSPSGGLADAEGASSSKDRDIRGEDARAAGMAPESVDVSQSAGEESALVDSNSKTTGCGWSPMPRAEAHIEQADQHVETPGAADDQLQPTLDSESQATTFGARILGALPRGWPLAAKSSSDEVGTDDIVEAARNAETTLGVDNELEPTLESESKTTTCDWPRATKATTIEREGEVIAEAETNMQTTLAVGNEVEPTLESESKVTSCGWTRATKTTPVEQEVEVVAQVDSAEMVEETENKTCWN